MKTPVILEVILYVSNQQESTAFYEKLLEQKANLNVPGMTEFVLGEHLKLGLMPNKGIARILGDQLPHPDEGSGIPRCELYFMVEDIRHAYDCALSAGARLISNIENRNWGDQVCYFADSDGHVIAFAQKTNNAR